MDEVEFRERCDVERCDMFSVYRSELSGRYLCTTHRERCLQAACDVTATFRCAYCGRELCNTHRHYPHPARTDGTNGTAIFGSSRCQMCHQRLEAARSTG